jgi:hypothetical protein
LKKKTKEAVALKFIRKKDINTDPIKKNLLLNEISILKIVKHVFYDYI